MALFLETQLNCPICRSSQIQRSFLAKYWQKYDFQYFDCASCNATFANPMPSDELISKGNSVLVRQLYQNRSFEQEFRDARQAYLKGKILARKLIKWKKKGRLLELGCFHGFFSLGVKQNSDWEVEGLEISPTLTKFAQEKLGIPCYLGTLEEADLPQNSYDFVVCHDLIEHVNQPRKFLKKLRSTLANQGQVQIITPNALQDLAFTRRAFQQGIILPIILNHIMYFSPRALRIALESEGIFIQKLYCYDVRYVFQDMGWLGLGKPKDVNNEQKLEMLQLINSLPEAEHSLKEEAILSKWTPEKLQELYHHPKTSLLYGWTKEILPDYLTIKVSPQLGIGHEIYALGELL